MRLVNERILHVWEQRRAEANERTTEQERCVKAIQQNELDVEGILAFAERILPRASDLVVERAWTPR
jgi:hypothetical protein